MRDPWGVSVYGARAAVMGIEPAAHTTLRFRGEALRGLDSESYRKAREDLRLYVAKGGLTLVRSGQPWSKSTIHSSDQANGAWGLVGRLAQETLPNASRTLGAAATQSRVKQAETVAGWGEQIALWQQIAREDKVFDEGIYEEDLDQLVTVLMPLAEGTARRATKTIASGTFAAHERQSGIICAKGRSSHRRSSINTSRRLRRSGMPGRRSAIPPGSRRCLATSPPRRPSLSNSERR